MQSDQLAETRFQYHSAVSAQSYNNLKIRYRTGFMALDFSRRLGNKMYIRFSFIFRFRIMTPSLSGDWQEGGMGRELRVEQPNREK